MAKKTPGHSHEPTNVVPTPKSGRKPPPADETPRARFLRVCEPRIVNVLHSLRLVAQMARGNYGYTPEDVAFLDLRLTAAVNHTVDGFMPEKSKIEQDFHFQKTSVTTD